MVTLDKQILTHITQGDIVWTFGGYLDDLFHIVITVIDAIRML